MVKTARNIFNLFKREEKQLEETPANKIVIQYEPKGSSGIEIFSGTISEDYLSILNSSERANIFEKMSLSDYQIIMCLTAVINPIKSATWEIEAASDDPEDIKDAELINHILFNDMNKTFDTFLEEALSFLIHGYSLFEVVHKPVINHPIFKSYIGVKTLGWRSQKTIERWNIDKDENLLSVEQIVNGDAHRFVKLDPRFLILFNIGAKGANFEGISRLRGCYGSWLRKNNYLKLNAAGIEKFSIPTPTVEVPIGKENSDEYDNLIYALSRYTSHQNNYLTYPSGWKVELNSNSGFDPSKIEISIDNEDKRITKVFLANFLELGMNGTGAYALSNDLSDFFLSGLKQVANEISGKINTNLIPDLIRLNKGEREAYPKLKVSNISDKAGQELANILSSAVNSQIIIPDDKLEDHFRKRFDLPARSDEGQRSKPQSTFNTFSLTDKIIKALKRGSKWPNRE